jgi:hypothetical protein
MTSENNPPIDDRTHDPGLHLFLDDHEVASVTNLTPVSGRPRRRPEPVVRPDRPWEGDQINAWGTVLRRPEDGVLQLWYSTGYMAKDESIPVTLCYAESRDGIAWEKPDLGMWALGEHAATNIVLMVDGDVSHVYGGPSRAGLVAERGGRYLGPDTPATQEITHFDSPNVVIDPSEPDPERRYKLLTCAWRRGESRHVHVLLTSPDGIRWTAPPTKVLEGINDATCLRRDAINSRWLLTCMRGQTNRHGLRVRTPYLTSSPDLLQWSVPWKPFPLDQGDDYGSAMQAHFMNCFTYGNQHAGIYSSVSTREGWCQAYLLASRDGTLWERPRRSEPWLARGEEGAFDEDQIDMAVNSPIFVGDDMLLYYTGRWTPADGKFGAMGVTTIKRDRFAGLGGGSAFSYGAGGGGPELREGEIVTTPVTVSGRHLYLNARSYYGYRWEAGLELGGTVRAALLDGDGREIDGFGLAACEPFYGDAVRHPVSWEGGGDLSRLQGQRVALRLAVNRATVYAYRFAD